MKKLDVLVGQISKHEIRYKKIIVEENKATITLFFEASEELYDVFKQDLVYSGFGISGYVESTILEVTEK